MQQFIHDESGAVTVDWVVLTAALVGLGLAVMGVVSAGVRGQSDDMSSVMTDGTIIRTAFTGDAISAFASACAARGDAGCDAAASSFQSLSSTELAAVADDTSFDDNWAGFSQGSRVTGQDADGNDVTVATWTDGSTTYDAGSGDYDAVQADFDYQSTHNAALAAERDARVN